MGYKPVSFAQPLYCWASAGHICMEWYDGAVIRCPTGLPVDIPAQLNLFQSAHAVWALQKDGIAYIGNTIGVYLGVRLSDGVLVSCGKWDPSPLPKFEDAGMDTGFMCQICTADMRTILSPARRSAFVLKSPVECVYAEAGAMYGSFNEVDTPVIITERGMVNFATDGTWVSPPARERATGEIPMGLYD